MAYLASNFRVNSTAVRYEDDQIVSRYTYHSTEAAVGPNGDVTVTPVQQEYTFCTSRRVPKLGVMIIGLAGNNGSTVVGANIAHREGISWRTKGGLHQPDYFGSITQASTISLGVDPATGTEIFVALKDVLPMVSPTDIEWGGWDINSADLATAMHRAAVFDWSLQEQLAPFMAAIRPLPSIYVPSFIASNQADRADNVLTGTRQEQLDRVRADIREFKASRRVDKVILLWSGTTERFTNIRPGVHDTAEALLAAIARDEPEISPSTMFAVASLLEGCPYLNGSPQNTFVPGLVELAIKRDVPIGGDDFKSGQTKLKSVLVDFLISAGIKPMSIVSYNHLGNNDGKNLAEPSQFRSKQISKSGVVDDMVLANPLLYKPGERPDHTVVIEYVPWVGDSKRAMDEYASSIFMGGANTISIHNTCEDSLLATPIMIDLVVLCELMTRIKFRTSDAAAFQHFHPVLAILAYLLKSPMTPPGTPVVNALFKQRACIDNIFRACLGLPAESHMRLNALTSGKATKGPSQ